MKATSRTLGGQLEGPNGIPKAPKRLQVEFTRHPRAAKLGPRAVKLRLKCGLERSSAAQEAPSCAWRASWKQKKGVLEGQLEKSSITMLPTERDRWSAGGAGEGKEGVNPSQPGTKLYAGI